jgi:predicted nucleotidyltransferase
VNLSKEDVTFLLHGLRQFFAAPDFKLILFGSYATGLARSNSDIDIAIQGTSPISPTDWQNAESYFEDSLFNKKVDLIDYHRVSPDFQKIIDRDGVRLDMN